MMWVLPVVQVREPETIDGTAVLEQIATLQPFSQFALACLSIALINSYK